MNDHPSDHSPEGSSLGAGCPVAGGCATAKTKLATFRAIAGTVGFLKLQSEITAEFFSGNRMIVEATPGVPPFIATIRVPYLGPSVDAQPNAHGEGFPLGSGGR